VTVLTIWSVRGGDGCTVVAVGVVMALHARLAPSPVLAVDLHGDLGSVLAGSQNEGLGVGDWLEAGGDAAPDALARLERTIHPGLGLLPRGSQPIRPERLEALAVRLVDEERSVVVDAGLVSPRQSVHPLVEHARRSLLVVRACPFSLERLRHLAVSPSGVVVVRERGRLLRRDALEVAAGAPVVAEVQVDPGIGASMDHGLARRPLPRGFVRAMGAIA
jgi:hypothetical protein